MPFIDLPDRIPGLRMRARGDEPWYRFRNVAADEAELFLYDEIGGWGTLAEDFIAELKQVTAPKLRVRVSSPGGSVFEGIALSNALRAHPAEVTVQVDGIAASIASVIAMAGDRVVIQPQAMIMVHEAAGGCLGNAKDMQDMADLLDKISDNIAGAYAEKAGGDVAEWRQVMQKETWFTAEEAVEAGLADEMMPARKARPGEAEPEMRTFDLAAYGYQGPRQAEPPKPAPSPAAPEQGVTLTFNLGDTLDEQLLDTLRQMVAKRDPAPTVEATIADTASGVHHTATDNSAWDGPGAVSAMPNDKATLRYCHAWYDPDGDPEAKSSYKFPHHKTKGGPANLAACRNGLARLDSASIPDSERDGVRKHLQAHLDDAKSTDDAADIDPVAATDPPVEPVTAAAPEEDDWTALVAALIPNDDGDTWSALVSNLIEPDASSSAATA